LYYEVHHRFKCILNTRKKKEKPPINPSGEYWTLPKLYDSHTKKQEYIIKLNTFHIWVTYSGQLKGTIFPNYFEKMTIFLKLFSTIISHVNSRALTNTMNMKGKLHAIFSWKFLSPLNNQPNPKIGDPPYPTMPLQNTLWELLWKNSFYQNAMPLCCLTFLIILKQ